MNTPSLRAPLFPLLLLGAIGWLAPGTASALTLDARWTAQPHTVSARFDKEWQATRNAIRLEHGWLFARNDAKQLYLVVDLTGDTGNDKPLTQAPWGDFLSVAFDVNLDGKITIDTDSKYAQHPGSYRLGRQLFKGPGRFSGLGPTRARLAGGFGRTPAARQPHRIWELAIPLDELKATPGGRVRLGIRTHSTRPEFTDSMPVNHLRDLKNLIEIRLASAPMLATLRIARLDPQALRRLVANQRVVVQPKLPRPPGRLTPIDPQVPCPLPEGEPVGRAILPNGTIELRFANGSKKLRFAGGWEIICPDGTKVPTTVLFSTQIPPTLPPSLPDETTTQWLEYHNTRLLGIIGTLVDDPDMVDTYLGTEASGWSVYQRIQTRSETISYLLAE